MPVGAVCEDEVVQIKRLVDDLTAVCEATDGNLFNIVDLPFSPSVHRDFGRVCEEMAVYFSDSRSARAALVIARLPKNIRLAVMACHS